MSPPRPERSNAARRRPKTSAAGGALAILLAVAACGDASSDETRPAAAAASPPSASVTTATSAPTLVSPPSPTPVEPTADPTSATAAAELTAAPPGSALALLSTAQVKGRAPKTGYDRDVFGQAWADVDRNGCDTRNDLLARDLTGETFRPGTRDCVVLTGTLNDPYTGRTLSFSKADASAVHIDHVVALSNAWQTGAQQWPSAKRLAFANDPLNLLAVDGASNQSKSDADAASWLPPNRAYRCPMVARQVAVKLKYGLWLTPPERDAIARILAACPQQTAPQGGSPTLAPIAGPAGPSTAPHPVTPVPSPATAGETDPRFGTCKEAKANGYGPYEQASDPEYSWYRDGDADLTVCE